jgi:hypothetical protein
MALALDTLAPASLLAHKRFIIKTDLKPLSSSSYRHIQWKMRQHGNSSNISDTVDDDDDDLRSLYIYSV